jgi:hypothetical protein
MNRRSLLIACAAFFTAVLTPETHAETFVDGVAAPSETAVAQPQNSSVGPGGIIDVVGGTSNSAFNTGVAKGNSYQVITSVVLNEAEFWLNFTGVQTLNYYVYHCPTEFGLYNAIYMDSEVVPGVGPAWYSSGPIAVPLVSGQHYIIAVSWSGAMTYYFDVGDSQPTSFGAYTHGYATGLHPLPPSFMSTVNDFAIYHQRLTTNSAVSVETSTWGSVKNLYR